MYSLAFLHAGYVAVKVGLLGVGIGVVEAEGGVRERVKSAGTLRAVAELKMQKRTGLVAGQLFLDLLCVLVRFRPGSSVAGRHTRNQCQSRRQAKQPICR